jgi:hypothetical protein
VEENVMSDTLKCKTRKGGEFKVEDTKWVPPTPNPFDEEGTLMYTQVAIKGSLEKPAKLIVEGTLSFNGAKKTFKKKTGEKHDFGTFPLKENNVIVLTGSVIGEGKDGAPPKDGTELVFEVESDAS